jgi:hypothetical protein
MATWRINVVMGLSGLAPLTACGEAAEMPDLEATVTPLPRPTSTPNFYRDAHADTCPDSNTLAHSGRYSHGDAEFDLHGDADARSDSDFNAGADADPGA